MPKGVFSIFKKDPLLIYDLVIFYILLLLKNFEFVLRKQSKLQTKLLRSYLFSSFNWPSLLKQQEDKDNVYG
jgi:hypothetical protein